jgi:hypothetical protein
LGGHGCQIRDHFFMSVYQYNTVVSRAKHVRQIPNLTTLLTQRNPMMYRQFRRCDRCVQRTFGDTCKKKHQLVWPFCHLSCVIGPPRAKTSTCMPFCHRRAGKPIFFQPGDYCRKTDQHNNRNKTTSTFYRTSTLPTRLMIRDQCRIVG